MVYASCSLTRSLSLPFALMSCLVMPIHFVHGHVSSSKGLRVKKHSISKKGKRLASKNIIPKIAPFAPIPNVYRHVVLDSNRVGLSVEVWKGKNQIPCLPKNQTPCQMKIVAHRYQVSLVVSVTHSKGVLRFTKIVKDRVKEKLLWSLFIPKSIVTTPQKTTHGKKTLSHKTDAKAEILFPEKKKTPDLTARSQKQEKSKVEHNPANIEPKKPGDLNRRHVPLDPPFNREIHGDSRLIWPWIVGGVVLVGGLSAGVTAAIVNRDRVQFRCSTCP